MKKILLILLAVVLTVSMLFMGIGCKEEAAAVEEETTEEVAEEEVEEEVTDEVAEEEVVNITFSYWGVNTDALYSDMISEFEKQNPNIKVEKFNYEDYHTKVQTLYAAGEAPDVMRLDTGQGGPHVLKGMFLPLNNYIDGEYGIDLNDFAPVVLEPFMGEDGSYFFIPELIVPMTVLYYNLDLFDEAGVGYPTSEWTINDLEAAAKTFIENSITEYGIQWMYPNIQTFTSILGNSGTLWKSDAKDEVKINTPEAVEAINKLQDWIWDLKITENLGTTNIQQGILSNFLSGRLPMITGGGWLTGSLNRDALYYIIFISLKNFIYFSNFERCFVFKTHFQIFLS